MASYFDAISGNRIKSILLMMVFSALFFLIVYVFAEFFGGGPFALVIGAIIIVAYAAFTYFYGSAMVLKISRAQKADRKDYTYLFDTIEGLALAGQMPMPAVYIIPDPSPNAFATGRDKTHASVAVTSGLLSMMNKRELEGVLAHEMSHVYNSDILFMMVAVVFAGAIGLMAAVMRNMFFFGGIGTGRNRDGGAIVVIGLVISFLAPLFALLIRLAISRRREYMADANGARMIRDPEALASALTKIRDYTAKPIARPVAAANDITASLYFSNPLSAKSVTNLFSSHPPIDERIDRLKHMY